MDYEVEIKALREVAERQALQINALKAHFYRYDEADLTALSIQGASGYCEEKMKNAPLDVRTHVLNAVAHGIYMGFRRKESLMGITKGENKNG